jgi:hypothetical protein
MGDHGTLRGESSALACFVSGAQDRTTEISRPMARLPWSLQAQKIALAGCHDIQAESQRINDPKPVILDPIFLSVLLAAFSQEKCAMPRKNMGYSLR